MVLIWALKQPLTTWTIAMHITTRVRSPARWTPWWHSHRHLDVVQVMSVMANFKYKSEDKLEARIRLIFPRNVDITEETVRKSLFTSGRFAKCLFVIKLLLSVAEVGGFLGMILGVSLMDLEMLFEKILLLVKAKRFSNNWLILRLNNIMHRTRSR